jgi:hypothetical protein
MDGKWWQHGGNMVVKWWENRWEMAAGTNNDMI